jgi:hypothetical protein
MKFGEKEVLIRRVERSNDMHCACVLRNWLSIKVNPFLEKGHESIKTIVSIFLKIISLLYFPKTV